MDILGKIAEINKSKEHQNQPASLQSVEEVMTMINEIAESYGVLVAHVEILNKQNIVLASKVHYLTDQVTFLLAKDPEYVAEAEKLMAEMQAQAKEGVTDVKTDAVSTDLPS